MNDLVEFLDFKINISTREVFKNNKKIDLQNKSYDLLMYLVENKDRAVSKDELIKTVWGGRVVTDSALTHAVYKLRTALRDTKGKELIIRTVRGFGLQFIAEIKPSVQIQVIPAFNKTFQWKIYAILAVFLIVIAILLLNLTKQPDPSTEKIIASSQTPKTTLGFFSKIQEKSSNDWLSHGMNIYLNQLIAYSDNTTPDLLFMNSTNIDEATIPKDTIINTVLKDNSIRLSYKNDIEPNFKISLDNIPSAVELINQWVCNEVLTNQSDCEKNVLKLTNNNAFIIENYMRGIAAIYEDNNENAINFLNICLQQDPNFLFARLSLATAYFKIARYKKSISELQTLMQLTDNIKIIQQAHILLGKNYFKTSQIKKSKKHLLQVINNNTPNNSIKAIAMMELALIYQEDASLEEAFEYAKKSSVILSHSNLPNHTARVNQIMGHIKKNTGDLDDAEKYFTQALNIYEKTGEIDGLESVLSLLSSVNQFQGKLSAAIAFAHRRQKIVERLGNPLDIAGSYSQLAFLQLESGELDAAARNANAMWNIVINEEEPKSLMVANLILGEVASAQGFYDIALDHYQDALKITQELGLHKRQVSMLCNMGKIALDGEIFSKAFKYLTLCKEKANELEIVVFKAVSRLYLGELARVQKQITKSDQILNEAMDIALKLNMDKLIYDIGLEFFYLYIEIDTNKAENNLQKIPEPFRDDFLFILAQAKLENKKSNYEKALQLILLAKQKGGDNWIDSDQNLLNEIQLNFKN